MRKEEHAALRKAAARSGRSIAELVREAIRKVVIGPEASEPVAIWDGEPKRESEELDLRAGQRPIALRHRRSPAPVRLEIERELPVMPDRQQIKIRVNLRVQHQVVIEDVFAQRFRVRGQRR